MRPHAMLVVWLALVATMPIAGSAHHRPGRVCNIEAIFPGEEEFTVRQSSRQDRAGVLIVPVTLRLMLLQEGPSRSADTEDEHARTCVMCARKKLQEACVCGSMNLSDSCKVLCSNCRTLCARQLLEGALESPWFDIDQGNVNKIWHLANIQFDLQFVERCRYGIQDVREHKQITFLRTPRWDQPETRERDIRRLRLVNARFGRSGFRGMTLYAWPSLDGNESGHGLSLQSCFSDTGGVWLTAGAFAREPHETSGPDKSVVAHIVAHEIGHVLGLPHMCTDPKSTTLDMRPCDSADRWSLMADTVWNPTFFNYDRYRDRRALSAVEIGTAQRMVRRLLSPSTMEDWNARTH